MDATDASLRAALRRLGYDAFRRGQERIVQDLLAQRDVLAIMPTGAGKSLPYQLLSQVLPRATVVISPLIALMQDQRDTLEDAGIPVAVVNSTLPAAERDDMLGDVAAGRTKLVYVTPETFNTDTFLDVLRQAGVALVAVDEAHCISQWGHDFRPAYLRLAAGITALGRPPILALTATAGPWVRQEIVDRLALHDPDVVVAGIDRPNLFFEVVRVEDEDDDRRVVHRLLKETEEETRFPAPLSDKLTSVMGGSGIIFTRTTDAAEETAGWLQEWGIAADFYHGQRTAGDRERVQQAFMAGDIRVVCATNAFGLGIDKPDIRFVIHRDVPASLDAYYQEAGRAGRDGGLARCVLVYRAGDLARAASLSSGARLSPEDLDVLWPLLTVRGAIRFGDLAERSGLSETRVAAWLSALTDLDVVRQEGMAITVMRPDFEPSSVSDEVMERQAAYARSRVEMMRGYAERTDCRRRYLLSYFGEAYEAERCEMCDNDCLVDAVRWVATEEPVAVDLPFDVGDRVVHEEWGPGEVELIEPDTVTILFETVGYKRLAKEVVRDRGLLRRADASIT